MKKWCIIVGLALIISACQAESEETELVDESEVATQPTRPPMGENPGQPANDPCGTFFQAVEMNNTVIYFPIPTECQIYWYDQGDPPPDHDFIFKDEDYSNNPEHAI